MECVVSLPTDTNSCPMGCNWVTHYYLWIIEYSPAGRKVQSKSDGRRSTRIVVLHAVALFVELKNTTVCNLKRKPNVF